jgi:DNA-directed RNA polymerase specialized sigma24 family protein
MEPLERYLSGDSRFEQAAVQALRRMGEAAAQRLGMQPSDADGVGVDFAAHLLANGTTGIQVERVSTASYVRRAAHWFAAKQLRSFRRSRTVPLDMLDEAPAAEGSDPVTLVQDRHIEQLTTSLLSGLPMPDQQLFRLCLLEGCSSTEAAAHLGCTPAAARKRLERLRSRLRPLLQASIDAY